MSYFTTGKSRIYEKMMTRVSNPRWEVSLTVLPQNHLCYGCKRYGQGCTHPCHREMRQNRNLEVAVCGL